MTASIPPGALRVTLESGRVLVLPPEEWGDLIRAIEDEIALAGPGTETVIGLSRDPDSDCDDPPANSPGGDVQSG